MKIAEVADYTHASKFIAPTSTYMVYMYVNYCFAQYCLKQWYNNMYMYMNDNAVHTFERDLHCMRKVLVSH
jgi:hypothetical protein